MKLLKASAVALIILMSGGGLVAAPPTLAAELTSEQTTMLERNPALAALAANAPMLQQAFQLIARAAAEPSGSQRGVEGLDAVDAQLLSENPALLQVWHSSPEASADLLALIKSAAGGGKPTK
ncbi:hypothetical protein [Devosia sp. CN2-171]|uniref:hypothetical protein n=1 Tax=Devosia sp. CN2-171 TaxID=3400909 RepID=UPI003BF8FEC1